MKKTCSMLICFLLLITMSRGMAYAENPTSVINNLYPSEQDLKLETNVKLKYKEVPPENYRWDTDLKFAEWDGIFPEFKNPGDVTDNTLSSGIFHSGVGLVRWAILLLQMGFSTNILPEALGALSGKIELIAEDFFKKVFPSVATILVIFMAIAWLRGRKGEMFKILFLAMLVSSLLIGGIKHITELANMTSGVIDELCLSIVGVLNIDNSGSASDKGLTRIANTSNTIWEVAVDYPWTAGQFGSIIPPNIMDKEREVLRGKGVSVNSSDNWKDLFLRYRPGSVEREALVKVLADPEIPHESEDASLMMKELAPSVRLKVAPLAIINSAAVLILTGIVGGLMIVSGLLLLAGMIASPFMVPLPFLGNYGINIIRRYLSLMIGFALLKVSATLYLTIIMVLLYLVSLANTKHYLIVQIIFLIILMVAIYLSPNIWRRMAPGLASVSGIGERSALNSYNGVKNTVKKLLPQDSDHLFERYGTIKESRSHERERQKKVEVKQPTVRNDMNVELASLKALKHENASEFVASGLDKEEEKLSTKVRKDEIMNTPLPYLQKQRQFFEKRKESNGELSPSEIKDLNLIQQAERSKVRALLKPSDRPKLDELWRTQKNLHDQKQVLMKQKLENPSEFIGGGGDMKLRYLAEKQRQSNVEEKALLYANTFLDPNKHPHEQQSVVEMQKYLKAQSNEPLLNKHLDNVTTKLDREENLEMLDLMLPEVRQEKMETMDHQLKEGVALSNDDKNDYLYMQHVEWKETIGNISDVSKQKELRALHTKEVGLETQLKKMNEAKTTEPVRYHQLGGDIKQNAVQKELHSVRQQTQESLRQSGYRDEAEKHVNLVEKREKLHQPNHREQELQKPMNEPGKEEKSNVVVMQDYKPQVQESKNNEKKPNIQDSQTPAKNEEIEKPPMTRQDYINKLKEELEKKKMNLDK